MPETANELILEVLRRIQADLKADVREIGGRVGSLETRMAHMEVRLAEMDVRIAELSVKMDRRDEQIERILRRLELTEHLH
jgi:uncharacterized coiled-coil protein SlyX